MALFLTTSEMREITKKLIHQRNFTNDRIFKTGDIHSFQYIILAGEAAKLEPSKS